MASVILSAGIFADATRRNQDKKPMPKPRSAKLLTPSQARRWAASAHRRRRRIVATNGCFDLLHFGHVSYLQRARQLGDLLVVGLNSDSSCRQLKGRHRPLVPERQRAAVLAALACVDAVVIFRDKRAHRFLAAVQPDVYVKGGDYRPETLDPTERAALKAAGTKIRLLPFVPGFSTTGLIKKIRRTGL
jgi:rfaE bifunctional protein nucleotidyltransferase chain/domain